MPRKLILFLVEGITEEISFGMIFSEIFNDKEIEFQIVHGDITTDDDVNSANIIKKISSEIDKFLAREHYNKNDILKIIHLVDTDGAYIPDKNIKKSERKNIYYSDQEILTNSPDYIKERNNKKSRILNRLAKTSEINKLSYKIYYLSCNLEHVLHDNANVKREAKKIKAEEFENKFFECEHNFIDYIKSSDFAVSGSYDDTWSFIKKESNSLKRFCNLHFIFKNY
ncbi:MAG: hypothetical protein ACOCV1_06125 [Bacillota bacterium]